MKTDKQVLLDAADHIELVGWHQGRMFADCSVRYITSSPCCAMGAVSLVVGDDGNEQFDRVWQHLNNFVGGSVIEWNDALGRTKEEVVAKLRELADLFVS